MTDLLEVKNLQVRFVARTARFLGGGTAQIRAVDDVSFALGHGQTLGIVGESGSGKSSLARAITRLIPLSGGRLIWEGVDVTDLTGEMLRQSRSEFQIIFQDALASLNPRMTVGEIISEPLRSLASQYSAQEVRARAEEALKRVGLLPAMIDQYPHEVSGGQCQRIGIARAIILQPKLIVCDEPVSALDVSVQAQILNLLAELQSELHLSMLFISHNLCVVSHVSHRVMVLYFGRVMEIADREDIYRNALHPYTQALLAAVPAPVPDFDAEKRRRNTRLAGELPSPISTPCGCAFRPRCPRATSVCGSTVPPLIERLKTGHHVACHNWDAKSAR